MESPEEYQIPKPPNALVPFFKAKSESSEWDAGLDDAILQVSNTIVQIIARLSHASSQRNQSADAAQKWAAALLDATEAWETLVKVRDER